MTDLEKLSARAAPYRIKDIALIAGLDRTHVGNIIARRVGTTTATIARINAAIDVLDAEKEGK